MLFNLFKILSAVDDYTPGGAKRIGFEFNPNSAELSLKLYYLGDIDLQKRTVSELQKVFITRFEVASYEETSGPQFNRTELTIYGVKVSITSERGDDGSAEDTEG